MSVDALAQRHPHVGVDGVLGGYHHAVRQDGAVLHYRTRPNHRTVAHQRVPVHSITASAATGFPKNNNKKQTTPKTQRFCGVQTFHFFVMVQSMVDYGNHSNS